MCRAYCVQSRTARRTPSASPAGAARHAPVNPQGLPALVVRVAPTGRPAGPGPGLAGTGPDREHDESARASCVRAGNTVSVCDTGSVCVCVCVCVCVRAHTPAPLPRPHCHRNSFEPLALPLPASPTAALVVKTRVWNWRNGILPVNGAPSDSLQIPSFGPRLFPSLGTRRPHVRASAQGAFRALARRALPGPSEPWHKAPGPARHCPNNPLPSLCTKHPFSTVPSLGSPGTAPLSAMPACQECCLWTCLR